MYPLFTLGIRGKLEPSLEPQALATSMGVTNIIAEGPDSENKSKASFTAARQTPLTITH